MQTAADSTDRSAALERFQDWRFGIFISWGLVSGCKWSVYPAIADAGAKYCCLTTRHCLPQSNWFAMTFDDPPLSAEHKQTLMDTRKSRFVPGSWGYAVDGGNTTYLHIVDTIIEITWE